MHNILTQKPMVFEPPKNNIKDFLFFKFKFISSIRILYPNVLKMPMESSAHHLHLSMYQFNILEDAKSKTVESKGFFLFGLQGSVQNVQFTE